MQKVTVKTLIDHRASEAWFIGDEVNVVLETRNGYAPNLVVEVLDADGQLLKTAEFVEGYWTGYKKENFYELEG